MRSLVLRGLLLGILLVLPLALLRSHLLLKSCTFRRLPYKCWRNYLPEGVEDSYSRREYVKRIYLQLTARLGNNLMQIASVYGLSQNTTRPVYFINRYLQADRILRLFPALKTHMKFVPCLPPGLQVVRDRKPNAFYENLANDITSRFRDVEVSGYLGSWKYWLPTQSKQIQTFFQIDRSLSKKAEAYLNELQTDYMKNMTERSKDEDFTYVGIQVRRGDKAYGMDGWKLPSATYFQKAMEYFRHTLRKNVLFVVVSEDKLWSKRHITGPDVAYSTSKDDLLELALLAKCNHTIMSAGTYSWWAAWLAGGQVVYYQNFTKIGSQAASWFNEGDYFLPDWKPMGD